MSEAYVYDAMRTPRGRGRPAGALHEVKPLRLVADLLTAVCDRNPGLDPEGIDDVVLGTVGAVGDQGGVLGRTAGLVAGLPIEVPGTQLSRYCASGLEAVNQAAARVRSGWEDLIVAGGVESMSRVPLGTGGDPWAMDPEAAIASGYVPQGISADLIATIDGFSREDLDAFAFASHQRAAAAWDAGAFDRSVLAVRDQNGATILARDEHLRPDTTLERLAALRPAFDTLGEHHGFDAVALQRYVEVERIEHHHTAGNSSGIVDGAALVVVGSAAAGRRHGLTPRAVIRSVAVTGSEPTIMLTGPVPASRLALARAGMQVGDVDLIEVNEAFAAVALRFQREMDVPHDQVNVNGGAIALGHPLGATGAMLLGTLIDELERRDLATGLVTLCVGGGMGIATVVERV